MTASRIAVLALAGVALALGMGWHMERRDAALMAANDCVMERWEEFEERTGTMPGVDIEQQWWRGCAEGGAR